MSSSEDQWPVGEKLLAGKDKGHMNWGGSPIELRNRLADREDKKDIVDHYLLL
jgi:hypothetical protein